MGLDQLAAELESKIKDINKELSLEIVIAMLEELIRIEEGDK